MKAEASEKKITFSWLFCNEVGTHKAENSMSLKQKSRKKGKAGDYKLYCGPASPGRDPAPVGRGW